MEDRKPRQDPPEHQPSPATKRRIERHREYFSKLAVLSDDESQQLGKTGLALLSQLDAAVVVNDIDSAVSLSMDLAALHYQSLSPSTKKDDS